MSPWEENDSQFMENVFIGHVEVVLQGGEVSSCVELSNRINNV
jgi:hypothetical protein